MKINMRTITYVAAVLVVGLVVIVAVRNSALLQSTKATPLEPIASIEQGVLPEGDTAENKSQMSESDIAADAFKNMALQLQSVIKETMMLPGGEMAKSMAEIAPAAGKK